MGEIKQMFNDNNKRFDANDDFLCKSVSELRAVSYTHLDVYKRQVGTLCFHIPNNNFFYVVF